jgi:hypothetical protein
MLCDLSISIWSAATYDSEVSQEVAVRHGAQANVGRYRKLLLPKEALADIRRIASEARRDHEFMTLPWDDAGYRVLAGALYIDHVAKMREHQQNFNQAVSRFIALFQIAGLTEKGNGEPLPGAELLSQYRSQLGSLFRSEDYPSIEELKAKFGFETKVMPLPDANDFRVNMGDEERDRIRRQITASVEASLTVATREIWQRTYDAVSHLADKLRTYKAVKEEGRKDRFHDSTVTNLVKLVDVMPKLNIAHDPELDRLTAEIRASLLVNPETLRKSESVRTETARAAARIAEQMAGYMGGEFTAALGMTA